MCLPPWLGLWLGLKIVPVLTRHRQSHKDVLRCPFLGCACRAAIHGVDPNAGTLSLPQVPAQTPDLHPPGPPSCFHPSFPHPGEDALVKTPSLPNLLLMIFVPLLALLVLVALMVLFCWKVAQHRHRHSDFGDTDLMLKASMMGDSTLEVGELREGP